jgi:hypothetical protein
MTPTDQLDVAIEQSHTAVAATLAGDLDAYRRVCTDHDDVTLGRPFGLFARGHEAVSEALTAGLHVRDAEIVGVQPVARYVSDTLACLVEVELYRGRVGATDDYAVFALRVTSVFRVEDGRFLLVHRHADPVQTPSAPDRGPERS